MTIAFRRDLRLKQAIGRTSRFQDQESLVLLLDQRVVTKRYGKQIIDGLQQVLPLHTTVRERLVEQAAEFLKGIERMKNKGFGLAIAFVLALCAMFLGKFLSHHWLQCLCFDFRNCPQ